MVGEDAVVHQPKPLACAGLTQTLLDLRRQVIVAQVGQRGVDLEGDVHGEARGERRTGTMRSRTNRPGLAAGPLTGATPTAAAKLELNGPALTTCGALSVH